MEYIDAKAIRTALPYSQWVDRIEKAFLLEEGKDYIMPERTHVNFGKNTLLLMPCIADKYFSTKLITLYPDNYLEGKASLQGLVILNRRTDGEALAVLDGPAITAMRTAAAGSFAIRHLSPESASRLGIIGLGTQGLHQALFACSERKISELTIFDQNKKLYQPFISNFTSEYADIKINMAVNSRDLCEKAEIIITATNSTEAVLPDDEEILNDKTIIGIGSYKENMREFPDSLYKVAGSIYIDSFHALKESGDLIYPLSRGLMKETDFHIAGDLMKGKKQMGDLRVFKSVGMALFDLLGSVLVYETLYMH
ncbi:MAG: ornithine cyclodeaminase family protein [Bacteroidales bacterium]|nr:ornithine cyclodeaminase family protein [Bacteroidales bacterium]